MRNHCQAARGTCVPRGDQILIFGVRAQESIALIPPNDQHQPQEPAAADGRMRTDINGWLRSAECCGSPSSGESVWRPRGTQALIK